jgi:hypothetical protein
VRRSLWPVLDRLAGLVIALVFLTFAALGPAFLLWSLSGYALVAAIVAVCCTVAVTVVVVEYIRYRPGSRPR